jgi:hypothetical protein
MLKCFSSSAKLGNEAAARLRQSCALTLLNCPKNFDLCGEHSPPLVGRVRGGGQQAYNTLEELHTSPQPCCHPLLTSPIKGEGRNRPGRNISETV